MVSGKTMTRFKNATRRLKKLGLDIEEIRNEIEDATIENIDEVCAKTEVLLKEYDKALEEYVVCDHAANYTLAIDHYLLKVQSAIMFKILECAANEQWSRQEILNMAQNFLGVKNG